MNDVFDPFDARGHPVADVRINGVGVCRDKFRGGLAVLLQNRVDQPSLLRGGYRFRCGAGSVRICARAGFKRHSWSVAESTIFPLSGQTGSIDPDEKSEGTRRAVVGHDSRTVTLDVLDGQAVSLGSDTEL